MSADRRLAALEDRLKIQEDILSASLFRLYDLSEIVRQTHATSHHNEEVFNHIRHLVDTAETRLGMHDDSPLNE